MKGSLEVTDLFKAAFLLCMGARLDRVRVRGGGRRIGTFLISGPDLDRLDSDYRAGRALVNPVQLRETLNHLRDVMFDKLRRHDPALSDRTEPILNHFHANLQNAVHQNRHPGSRPPIPDRH